jgi:WD40 repeat protein
LAAAYGDNGVPVWTLPADTIVHYLNHASYVHSVAFSPDNAQVVSGDGAGTAIIWEIATGKILRYLKDPEVSAYQASIREWSKTCVCDTVCTCDAVCTCHAESVCPSDNVCTCVSVCSSNAPCSGHSICTCNLVCTCDYVIRSVT